MPVTHASIDVGNLCLADTWAIVDRKTLVRLLGILTCGHHLHAQAILAGRTDLPTTPQLLSLEEKLKLFGPPASDPLRWHRDGYIFQLLSWVCARKRHSAATLIRPPQEQTAAKGLDGLILYFSPNNGSSVKLIICEDKATDDPRDTIREQVWPELKQFEDGLRDAELQSQASTLLALTPGIDALEASQRIHWENARAYRVNITGTAKHTTRASVESLFKDFDSIVKGDASRRYAEVLPVDAMRAWMDELCAELCTHLRELRAAHV